ncbi:MAG: hypothetical protein M9924_21920 [Rhizobiaceae bacterium]|nr:hypothetical protein [Rhizobiaceae bacterium]
MITAIKYTYRTIKFTALAFWMLAGLVMLLAWVGFVGWLLLWAASSAYGWEWGQSIAVGFYKILLGSFWLKLLLVFAIPSFFGLFQGEESIPRTVPELEKALKRARHAEALKALEEKRKKEEEWQMAAIHGAIGARNMEEDKRAHEQSLNYRW